MTKNTVSFLYMFCNFINIYLWICYIFYLKRKLVLKFADITRVTTGQGKFNVNYVNFFLFQKLFVFIITETYSLIYYSVWYYKKFHKLMKIPERSISIRNFYRLSKSQLKNITSKFLSSFLAELKKFFTINKKKCCDSSWLRHSWIIFCLDSWDMFRNKDKRNKERENRNVCALLVAN